MALLDKVLGKDAKERELEKEIRSLELRKESVFSAINGEIMRLQKVRTDVLLSAGTTAYEVWCKEQEKADLTKYWNEIQELENQIQEQENKKKEMGIKYDEEIRLINSNLNMHNENRMPVATNGAQCPKCGMAIKDNDLFCQSCGTKLK